MIDTRKIKKLLILNIPYIIVGVIATNIGEAWRMAEGADSSAKLLSLFSTLSVAFGNPLPSFYPLDLLIGIVCGASLRLAVYLRGKNAKKYRHNVEYGSARWGTAKDIEPFMAPKFEDNVILTKTERLMMSNRPKNPANARNKNVLIVGGSGSGKTRFWLKPNLLQMHSSYVVTDPKGSIVIECGNALLKNNYNIKIFNTINFKKSMHYNPMAYIHSEKDILKLVTTLIANTKGDGKAGDEFWTKAETLLYCALIGYIHYEAPVEEQNFSTLIEFLNAMEVREDDEEFQNPVDMMFEAFGVLVRYHRQLQEWLEMYSPESPEQEIDPRYIEAIHQKDYVEYLMDTILSGDPEEKTFICAERNPDIRKIVHRLSQLSNENKQLKDESLSR